MEERDTWEIDFKIGNTETKKILDSKFEVIRMYTSIKLKFSFEFLKIYKNCEDVTEEINEFLEI